MARIRAGWLQGMTVFVALLGGAVACGDATDTGASEPDTDVGVEVSDDALPLLGTDDLRFEPESLSADAGTMEFVLTCESQVNHNVVIVSTGEQVAACQPGETAVGSVELDGGSYEFVCTVPGHSATMRGELSVG